MLILILKPDCYYTLIHSLVLVLHFTIYEYEGFLPHDAYTFIYSWGPFILPHHSGSSPLLPTEY
jgi:hypothetical protein